MQKWTKFECTQNKTKYTVYDLISSYLFWLELTSPVNIMLQLQTCRFQMRSLTPGLSTMSFSVINLTSMLSVVACQVCRPRHIIHT